MNRSIGDTIAKKVGVISDPEITMTKIIQSHNMIEASDGIRDNI